jgi:putative phage-type endonuclease
MQIHDCIQRDSAWHALRELKLTASNATAIKANGKGLDTLVLELVAEYMSNAPKESYTNEAMENGVVLEDEARGIYEIQNSVVVQTVGFISEGEYIGCSPDGLVGTDGLIEIKCPTDKVYLEYLLDGAIDSKYMNQMQMQMSVTGRDWCDYVVYNPNFKDDMVVVRVPRDEKAIAEIERGLIEGTKKIQQMLLELEKKGITK